MQDFNKAIELDPKADYYISRGYLYGVRNRMPLACSDLKKACEMGNCNGLENAMKMGECF